MKAFQSLLITTVIYTDIQQIISKVNIKMSSIYPTAPPPYHFKSEGTRKIVIEEKSLELSYKSVNVTDEDKEVLCRIIESALNKVEIPKLDFYTFARSLRNKVGENLILNETDRWKCVVTDGKMFANGFTEDTAAAFFAVVSGLNILVFSA